MIAAARRLAVASVDRGWPALTHSLVDVARAVTHFIRPLTVLAAYINSRTIYSATIVTLLPLGIYPTQIRVFVVRVMVRRPIGLQRSTQTHFHILALRFTKSYRHWRRQRRLYAVGQSMLCCVHTVTSSWSCNNTGSTFRAPCGSVIQSFCHR